jgi:hypothetical protein
VDWFVLHPSVASPVAGPPAVGATVASQGLVTSSQNLLYPDIAVDAAGRGYLVMSVAGPAANPSAASMAFNGPAGAAGPVRVAGAGTAPEDGFTCYATFVGPGKHCRWGDYSMGVAWGGRIYHAAEYIPPLPRDHYTNWGTFIWSQPSQP